MDKEKTARVNLLRKSLEVSGVKRVMFPGDKQLIKPNQKHRFTGLKDSVIIEFSTHHKDEDSYRDEVSGKANLEELI